MINLTFSLLFLSVYEVLRMGLVVVVVDVDFIELRYCHRGLRLERYIGPIPCLKKVCHFYFHDIFGNSGPAFNFFHC